MKKQQKMKTSLRAKMILLNSGITLAALLLCGLVFVFFVWTQMQENMRNDLEFFITQTNENLNAKTEYLEQVVYRLREDEDLIPCLKGEGSRLNEEQLQSLFQRRVDISSIKNYAKDSLPVVEQVGLFVGEAVYHTSYYAMIEAQEKKQHEMLKSYYEAFHSKKEDSYSWLVTEDQKIYLFYPLYDDEMEAMGTLAFVMQVDTFVSLMSDLETYEDSFWVLYDAKGQVIAEKNGEGKIKEFQKGEGGIKNRIRQETLGGEEFFLEDSSLCMGLYSMIGIPKRQIMIWMHHSVNFYTGLILTITIAAAIAFIFVIFHMTVPLKELTRKLEQVRQGEFETKLPDYNTSEFYEISTTFNEMTDYVNRLINQVYEKQISMKEMELKFYQTQMNPHFMFNVLNTIGLQARMDNNEEVFQMITSFSRLIQAKIYREGREKVKISQELEYVKYYLYLQKNRFGNRLSYEIEIASEELGELLIPKLCIQLIVENAVVHGIEPKVGKGTVQVHIYRQEGDICIDTIDNGVGFGQEGEVSMPLSCGEAKENHNHVGLNNAHKIIRLAYGDGYGIRVFSGKEEGTVVSIRIPADREEESADVQGNDCG